MPNRTPESPSVPVGSAIRTVVAIVAALVALLGVVQPSAAQSGPSTTVPGETVPPTTDLGATTLIETTLVETTLIETTLVETTVVETTLVETTVTHPPTTGETPPSTVPGTTTTPAAVIVDSPASQEARFVRLINGLRAGAGLQPLLVDAQLTAGARAWASEMAAYDQLVHAPDLSTGVSADWTVLAENIGHHTVHDVDALFNAFVNSGSHYRNLVDPRFHYLGVGVVHGEDGSLWTTHRFMATSEPPSTGSTTVPATVATPTTTTAPPETVATTTTRRSTTSPTTTGSTTRSTNPPGSSNTSGIQPPTTLDSNKLPGETPSGETEPAQPVPPTTQPAGVPHDPAGMADLVQPDVETIESLLIDLLTAGI